MKVKFNNIFNLNVPWKHIVKLWTNHNVSKYIHINEIKLRHRV